jgi:hypothetical protein
VNSIIDKVKSMKAKLIKFRKFLLIDSIIIKFSSTFWDFEKKYKKNWYDENLSAALRK